MRPAVKKLNPDAEFPTAERCLITETANDDNDEAVSVARARVEPGITTAWHRLSNTAERYLIVSGQGRMEMKGTDPTEVAAGDVVQIPPDTPQRITNIGPDDLIFYAVCTPPFTPECYTALE